MNTPQAAAGTWTRTRRGQRTTSRPPNRTNTTNAACTATTMSAAARSSIGGSIEGNMTVRLSVTVRRRVALWSQSCRAPATLEIAFSERSEVDRHATDPAAGASRAIPEKEPGSFGKRPMCPDASPGDQSPNRPDSSALGALAAVTSPSDPSGCQAGKSCTKEGL